MQEGKATSSGRTHLQGGRKRRLQQATGDVRVPFEVMRAPGFLDAQLMLDPSTATAMEVHLSQLFIHTGVVGTISDLRLKEPEVVYREVTKKETSMDEWFYTYPVDPKIESVEPLEPGIASGGCPACGVPWTLGILGLLWLNW